ncbi:unnamed protein product [Leuciscus chuanchicus]
MDNRYSLEQTLHFILDESDNEEHLENADPDNPDDFTTDTEDETEFQEDYQESEEEDYEEEGHADEMYLSKNGNIVWYSTPPLQRPGRASASRIIKLTPGPTSDTHCLVSYCPKKGKNVLLMSTCHKEAIISDREDKKPQVILDYNHCKGGVDTIDKMIATYSCKRRTARWPMALFSAMIDVSAINAFVVWKAINPEWERGKCFKRRLFLEQLGKALVSPHMKSRKRLPRTPASVNVLKKIQDPSSDSEEESPGPSTKPPSSKRKRCEVCPRNKDTKSGRQCTKCNKNICLAHTVNICKMCMDFSSSIHKKKAL